MTKCSRKASPQPGLNESRMETSLKNAAAKIKKLEKELDQLKKKKKARPRVYPPSSQSQGPEAAFAEAQRHDHTLNTF